MTRVGKTVLIGFLVAFGLVFALASSLLVVAIFWPLPLSFLQSLVSTMVSRTMAPLSVAADDVAFTWDPASGSITLIASDIRLTDADGALLGELPYGEADVRLVGLLTGQAEIEAIRLQEPTIALAVDSQQGLRLSVSPYGPATKLPMLKGAGFEQTIAALWDCRSQALPAIHLEKGVFFFLDQDAAVYLTFVLRDMELLLQPQGSQVTVSSHLLVAGQRLSFDLAARQDCATKSLTLSLFPQDIHPAVLGEVIPGGRLLYPFEVPVSGRLDMHFGPDRDLQGLDFNLTGGAGSLEVASYAARNLSVDSLQLIGVYSSEERELTLNRGRFDLAQGTMLLEGRVYREVEGIHLALRVDFRGGELLRLLPRWFSGLRTALRKTLKAEHEAGDVSLSLDGVIDNEDRIDAQGSFVVPFGDPGGRIDSKEKLRLDFKLDGQISAPRLVVSGQEP